MEIQAGSGMDSTSTYDRSIGIIHYLSSASMMEVNPIVQAGALSTDLGEIPHASPFPTPFDQAGAIDGGVDQLKESCRFIPLCQILKATNDFDDALVIGRGGFGKVYKANIDDGGTTTVVAIKRSNAESKQGAEEFWTEVKLLSKLRHTNLVSLIGYCNENQEMILVYEYMAQGTLADHLYKTSREESGGSRSHLTWEQRLNICLDAARGLDYLHNGTLPGIIHRDVKSTNILLDEHLVAKVSDLGLSKSTTTHTATHVSTCVKGSYGYLDPFYFITQRLTKKADVYAFGVVLLEVLCGRLPIDGRFDEEQISLVLWARMNIKEGTLDRIIDPSLNGDTTPDSLKYFAELANKCLHSKPRKRPTMTEVVKSLQIALVSHERQGRSQGTIAKAWTLGGLLSRHRNPLLAKAWMLGGPLLRHRNPLLVPPKEIQKSSIPANGVQKPAKRIVTAFLATNFKAFGDFTELSSDFKARSKETFMIHQENIVKKEEGFINEHLPDHVFANSKKNEDKDETVNKVYNRKGSGHSMELKHWATFKKLGMDPGNKNNRAYQSGVLLSNSKKKKKIEALKRLGGSLIPILGLEDYNTPLSFQALSGLSNIFHGFLSGCGDGQIILLNTNHNHIDRADVALQRPSSPQPKALPDGGEIVLLDSSEQKPSVGFEATNNRAYQSDVLVSNSEEKNTGEASRRRCMSESVLSLVDSTTSISSTYFNAPDNGAHFAREYQSGPIVFNSEKKDTGEGLNRECLTKSALSLDDSTKPRSSPDFNATETKAAKVYTSWGRGCWHSMEELEQGTTLEELGMDPENEGIISDLLRFVSDKEEFYKKAGKDWKRGYLLYDSPGTDRSSLIAAMANFLEFDIYHLDLTGLTSISELTNVLVSIRNRSLIAIKDFDQWAGKLPDFKTELTLSGLLKIIHGLLSSCGDEQIIVLTTNHSHIDGVDVALLRPLNIDLYIHTSSPQPKALPDGGEIVLLDSSEQKPSVDFDATNNRTYQSDVLVSNSKEKNTRGASRRQCMREGVPSLVDSMELEQPATFGELGMDPDNNYGIISDLLRFIMAKDIYKKAGKDWKRGYLLYDTPGTDRSSLIAFMANRLEFHIYHLDLTGFSSISELRNVLVSIRNRSLIAIKDFDRWAGMLPILKNELTLSGLSKIIHSLLSRCGDEQIIVLTTNHNHIDGVDASLLRSLNNDLYIHTPSPQPKALPDGGEIVLLDSSEQKPSVDFDATNNRAYQSNVLVSNSGEKNTREASRRQCMPEGVPSLVDSTTRISLMDFDALDNNAHLVRAYQSGPIVFTSEKKDRGEGLNRECLTKSALSLDDSTKPRLLPDFDSTENEVVKVYTGRGRGCWDSMELEQRTTLEELGMDPENKGIISDLLRFVRDKEEFYKKAGKDWKRCYLYDSPATDRSNLIAAMANFLEFDIYHLDLAGLTSISELTNVLVSIRNGSLIAIKALDHWAGKLPDFRTELTLSSLLKIIHGLLSSCGDERIIVLTTNHNHIGSVDAALLRSLNIDLYIHTSSPQPKALPDGGEIVLLDPSKQKPSVDFDATNNRAYQSDILVSDSEEKNTREASRRQCMPESVPSLVDSTTRISLTDFDAPDNSAHLVMAYQSGPIVFNSEKKDMGEVLSRECLTKSVLSLDDSSKQKSLSDVAVTGKKSHIVRAYESGPVVSFSDDKNGGEALKRECITKSILGLEDLQQHSGGRGDDAAKSFCAIYDPGIHMADSLARISFEVLETLPTREQPNDCVPLLSLGRLTLEDCVQQEKSPDLPRVTQINGVEQRVTKLPRYFGGLTAQSASSSRWPIGLQDRGYIVPLDPLDQSTKHIEYVAREDQCSPTLSLAEKKIVRKTLKRKCRTMSVIFEDNHQHFARRCEGDAKSLGVKRIKNQGIHQWPFFRQKWATRKGYSLGEEIPFEVRCLSMDETLDSRLQLIHMSQFARSSPRALALPDGGEIVRPTALSSSEFAATNNRAHLVSQDQNRSTASHYKCKNSRETSDKQGLEDLQQHFGCEHKHALKSLGVSGSMFKSTCKQHWFYWWQGRLKNNEQQLFDATSNRAHLVKADERGPTVSNALFLEDLRHQFGARCKDAAKGLHDSLAWKSFKVQDNLPLGEQSNTRRRSLTHKHCVRLKKSQDLPRSMLRDCATGLATQSNIGLPNGGHILSLSEKKIVRKTLKRKCRTMSVLSLEDHQQHVGRRWEDTVKFLGAKRICRQVVIHRETTAKRIRRQLGTRRWLYKQSAIGLPDGGHILYRPEKKIVRKTLKRKCRSISVLSLEDHKQHDDRRWEDAEKSHGMKRVRRQLVIHRLSTAKRTHKQHGIHQWPFQRSAISLPDRGHILSLSEKKIVRKTLKRKCRSMSVLSLVDRQQHVDRRWEDAAKNIGAKRICRQLVIHRVSIAKRICRQHGIHHRWPFERDRGTMKGYTLGDEKPVEVIRLSTDGKLVSRLQVIYISWLGRFSPPPSTLPGGKIVGHIALSSSQFATTTSIAQCVGQDQSGSTSSDSENERTREQEDSEEMYSSITFDDLRRLYRRMNRKDAAASLGVSVTTFKRKCRELRIERWPHVRKKKVGRPPDQHEERNTSTTCKTPLHNVHARMEGEPVGQNQEANEFQRDLMEPSIALNAENDSTIAVYSETEAARGSTFQTMQSTTYPYRNDPVFSQPQTASKEVPNENMGSLQDRRDLLASQEVAPQQEPLSEGHVSGFGNWTVGSCSDLAPTQPMHTFSHATGSSENLKNLLAFVENHLMEGDVGGSSMSDPALSENLTSMEKHLMEGNVCGSSMSDPALSQPMRTIRHTMATIPHMMPLPTERQDTRSVKIKATYEDTNIKFQFPLTSGIKELKEVMSKILERKLGSFKVVYKDEDGKWILMALDEHVREYLQLVDSLGDKVTELKVQNKVPHTTNFCDNCRCYNCRSLKRKRP